MSVHVCVFMYIHIGMQASTEPRRGDLVVWRYRQL